MCRQTITLFIRQDEQATLGCQSVQGLSCNWASQLGLWLLTFAFRLGHLSVARTNIAGHGFRRPMDGPGYGLASYDMVSYGSRWPFVCWQPHGGQAHTHNPRRRNHLNALGPVKGLYNERLIIK